MRKMIQKNIAMIFVMLFGVTAVFALTSSTCGNNVCEEIKFILKEGESKTITVNGISHTFRLDRFDNGDFLSVDGSTPMGFSSERNIFMDEFKQKYGNLIDKKMKEPGDIYFNTKLGELVKVFSFILKVII
mgnify:CR=1 FL=1